MDAWAPVCLVVLFVTAVIVGINWVGRRGRPPQRSVSGVPALHSQSRREILAQLAGEPEPQAALERAIRGRETTLEILRPIRAAPRPIEALDKAIAEREVVLGFLRSLHEAPDLQVALQEALAASGPEAALSDATSSEAQAGGADAAAIQPPPVQVDLRGWLALDNITLLLYLGAALIVIAAGVFLGSSWDAIGPLARWGAVTLLALAFLGTGEFCVRRSPALVRAGETFRGLGTVLLPFIAVAYDRFVLRGAGSPAFWTGAVALLAVAFYALHRWSNPGRLTASLASLSVGVLGVLLPRFFDLHASWGAPSLLCAAAALLAIARREHREGSTLLRRIPDGPQPSPLAESHLVVGLLVLAASLVAVLANIIVWPPLPVALYFVLLTGLLALLALWLRQLWLVAAAVMASGAAVWAAGLFILLGRVFSASLFAAGWNLLAVALFALARRAGRRLPRADQVLMGGAVAWSGAALAAAWGMLEPFVGPGTNALVVATSLALAVLLASLAARYRRVEPLAPALVLLHAAILQALQLVPATAPSLVIPTLIWLLLAALWLAAERWRQITWAPTFWRGAFVAEALWTSLFAASETRAAVLAGLLLVAGWALWAGRRRSEQGVVAALVQALYAAVALVSLLRPPPDLLPLLAVVVAALLVILAPRLSDYTRRAVRAGGLTLALAAPAVGLVAGLLLTLPEPRFLSEVVAAQCALGLAFALYAWVAVRRQSESLTAVAVGQITLLAAWFTLDYLPAVAAPFAAFGLALALLWAAPRAPGRSLRWLEPVALAYALVAPLAGILAEFLGAPARPLLGLGVVSAGQLALLLTTVLFVARGWLLRRRLLTTTGVFLLYVLYAWIAAERGATAIQLYTVPLGVLVFALAWLFPETRHEWELGAAAIVLLPAGLQSLAYADLLYSVLLGAWGLALLMVGVSLSRRIPITAGAAGLLLAALRQLWNIVATLPTWAIIGIVGLTLMGLAVLLLLRRDRLLRIGELSAGYWARLGEAEAGGDTPPARAGVE